ncbi:hypothetical protein K08M3_50560 [Vibrio alginolyticus]|uniref:Uncharacterized protein n=1 Tax=Vibrio alginolyticus TaxID=663 RepID=A0A1W6TLI3_VIBAL|nr:hypothetical protein [Vibrio alginolyticus]ARP06566.1 hypothetical protein K04M1_50430 [Vibrio alginolyticus]ARP11699.1 hypothetical protein K04M3_51300 [Vibrio alginolyticus]ARP16752.1 hypothetical protein K04M5_51000 [Vibrio alginolyticus]ARP21789.1 hypothetical protein K05K4_50870 [Vibrio alginolyticus]ARP26852.1 hypothetical protein K06K5_50520 [Vibrio alginolyticus]
MDKPHPIYPSQTETLKHRSKKFAEHIAKETNTKILSAFKRNDWLSQALGYKSHTDLLKSTEFRKQADQNQPLALFSDSALRLKIVDVFSHRTNISNEVLSLCSKQVAEQEVILNNTNPRACLPMAMYIDEAGFYETRLETELRENINSTLTTKLGTPRLVVDLSELPNHKQLIEQVVQSNKKFENPLPNLFTDQEALTLKNVFEEKNGIVIFSGHVGSSKNTVAKQVIESNLIPLTRESNEPIEHGLELIMRLKNSGYIFAGELDDEANVSKFVEKSQKSLCIGIVHALNKNDAVNEMVRLGLTIEQWKQVKAIVHCERKGGKSHIQLKLPPQLEIEELEASLSIEVKGKQGDD